MNAQRNGRFEPPAPCSFHEEAKFLLCASRHSLKSWWVDVEIEAALAKERRRRQDASILIPLNLDGHIFSKRWKGGKAIKELGYHS